MILLALPSLPLGLMQGPAGGILASIYVSHYGISLSAVGFITLASRMFDAVTDPTIGYLSDRTNSKWGRRKPFVFVGMLIVCISTYFVFIPPTTPTTFYFLSWFLLLYFGWTLTDIPMSAWSAEITSSAQGRMRIFMYRWVMTSGGWIVMFVIPFLPIFATKEITPETLRWVGWISLLFFPIFVLSALTFVGQGRKLETLQQGAIWPFLVAAWKNGAFRVYLISALLSGMSTGVYFALSFLYFTQVLGYAESYAIIGLVTAIVAIPAYYVWTLVSDRVGHYRMCATSAFGIAAFTLPLAFLPPGDDYFPVALILLSLSQMCASGWWVGTGPLLADAADYDLLKTGVNRTGKYFSFQAFVNKVSNGLGGGAAFAMLSLFGYDATVGAVNPPSAVAGFKFAMVGVPVLMATMGGLVVLRFPITPRRHEIIQKRLMRRSEALLR